MTTKKSASKKEEVSVNVKKSLEIDVYSELPSIEDFTKKKGKISFENVPTEETKCEESDKDCKVTKIVSKIGDYEVVITIKDKKYKATLKVVDKTEPTLKVKELTITEGDTYTVDSFVEEKSDNSKKDVKVKFEDENMANIKEVGEHVIKIVAEDESGNSNKAETKLIINKKEELTINNNSSSSNNSSGNSTPAPSPTPSAPAVQECIIKGPYTGLYANGTRDADYAKWEAEIIRVKDFIATSASNKQRFGDGAASSKGPETVVHDSCGKAVGYIMRIEANYISTGEAHYDEGGNLVVDVAPVKYHMEYYLDHNGNWVVTSNPHNIAWR